MKTQENKTKQDKILELKQLHDKIQRAPQNCGCYLWKNKAQDVLYIGKARNIRSRLQNYLHTSGLNRRIVIMTLLAKDVEWILTATENEALILEANLIKRYGPRFNVRLKDDKRYPYLCISTTEPYPRVYLTRSIKNPNNLYFGPYTDVGAARKTLRLIHKIFPVRKLRQNLPLKRLRRPCINFHIKRCLAPCQGNISEEEYASIIKEIILFMEGKIEILERKLLLRMEEYSVSQEYEKASVYRDLINSVRKVTEKQTMDIRTGDKDVIGIARKGMNGQIVVLEFRSGRMIGRKSFPLTGLKYASEGEILEAFVRDHYIQTGSVPSRVEIPVALPNQKLICDSLHKRLEYKVRFILPRTQITRKLSQTAHKNADELLLERLLSDKQNNLINALKEIQKIARLKKIPSIMECYDISHTQGTETVASGIQFQDGNPHLPAYRHYRIQSVKNIDDPASMKEVIERRIRKMIQENQKAPDLFLIDGGAAQVNVTFRCIQKAVKNLAIDEIPTLGLAKQREEIYFPMENKPKNFEPNSAGMRLLRRMRNEAHRFAVQYHRKRRNQLALSHIVEEIGSIGETRKKALLKHFSAQRIERASLGELAKVPGIGKETAKKIHSFFFQRS